MTPQKRVAVLVGSLRKGSFTRMAVNSLVEVAPAELKLEIFRELYEGFRYLDQSLPARQGAEQIIEQSPRRYSKPLSID